MLWDSWSNLKPQLKILHDRSDAGVVPEHSFLGHAMQHIRVRAGRHDPGGLRDDWFGTMRRWGVKEDLIERIMDTQFKQVRLTGTAGSRVLETFQDAFNLLFVVRMVSEQRGKQRRAGSGDGQVEGNMAAS